jgi:hypothetical protein
MSAWLQSWRSRLSLQAQWADELDFAGPRPRTSVAAWLVLATGVMALLWVVEQAEVRQQAIADAQAQLKRLSLADRQVRLARAAATAPGDPLVVEAPPPLMPDAWSEAAQMAALLAYPWQAALQGVSTRASDRNIVMTSFSLDLSSWNAVLQPPPAIRVTAAASSDEEALAWAADLPRGQLLTRAPLAMPFSTARSSYSLKVEAQTRWWPGSAP